MTGQVKIALFCGGRGSATIIRAFLRRSEVQLTLLVNAFDDGLSTGALRSFIPGMLGPSDFRKNLSYLLGNYSDAQYALRNLMEHRLPKSDAEAQTESVARFARTNNLAALISPLKEWFAQLPKITAIEMRGLLTCFFNHASETGTAFDYRDCSLGNLVFAGAYLACDSDFNAAAAKVGKMVGSRARLINVSENQNRHLAALQNNGDVLASEAEIVAPHFPPIETLYFLESPLSTENIRTLSALNQVGRQAFLATRNRVPSASAQAGAVLAEADIIIYGPGTQHSSLLPSYQIAATALAASPAPVKALIVNLENDHDIADFSAADLVQRATEHGAVISDILLNADGELGRLTPKMDGDIWRGARVWRGIFANTVRRQLHNGEAVADLVLSLLAQSDRPTSIEVFADMHNRSIAGEELVEEFLETVWSDETHITLNRVGKLDAGTAVAVAHLEGLFPEIAHLRDWLANGTSDYLVLMTGDGAYNFRDVQAILRLLERQPALGGVFGSRTQSRKQFIASIQSAYGERRLLYAVGKAAAFFLSMVFHLRTGIIFSDPLTGLRVFRRRAFANIRIDDCNTPLALAQRLVKVGVEVAEIPVVYRTFSGFTDPNWRVRRGLANLTSLL